MATYSPYAIESIIRQGMADDTSIALDSYLIEAVAGSATRPAGLLNGRLGTHHHAIGGDTGHRCDGGRPQGAGGGASRRANGGRKVAILLNPAQALALGFAQTTTGDFLFY